MKRVLLGTLIVFLAQPALAQSGQIELTPGLWKVKNSIVSEGTGQSFSDTQKTCISSERAKTTFSEIAADMVEGDQCSLNFTDISANAAQANAACDIPEDETRIRGTFSGNWTRSTYTISGVVQITGPGGNDTVRYDKLANFIGPCP